MQVQHNAVRGHHTAVQRTKTQEYALTRLERAIYPNQPFLVLTAYKTPLHTITWIPHHSTHLEDHTSHVPFSSHDRIHQDYSVTTYTPYGFSFHCDFANFPFVSWDIPQVMCRPLNNTYTPMGIPTHLQVSCTRHTITKYTYIQNIKSLSPSFSFICQYAVFSCFSFSPADETPINKEG